MGVGSAVRRLLRVHVSRADAMTLGYRDVKCQISRWLVKDLFSVGYANDRTPIVCAKMIAKGSDLQTGFTLLDSLQRLSSFA